MKQLIKLYPLFLILFLVTPTPSWSDGKQPHNATLEDPGDFCRQCHSNKNTIPIVYGFPGPELLKKAEKGKVRLGGCIIHDCYPEWFCNSCQNTW